MTPPPVIYSDFNCIINIIIYIIIVIIISRNEEFDSKDFKDSTVLFTQEVLPPIWLCNVF